MKRESFSRAPPALQAEDISVRAEAITIRDAKRLATTCGLDLLIDGPEESSISGSTTSFDNMA